MCDKADTYDAGKARMSTAKFVAGVCLAYPENIGQVLRTRPGLFGNEEADLKELEQRIKEIQQRDDTVAKTKEALAGVMETYLNPDYIKHHHGVLWKLNFAEEICNEAGRRNQNKKRKNASNLVTARYELDTLFLEDKATIVKPKSTDHEEH